MSSEFFASHLMGTTSNENSSNIKELLFTARDLSNDTRSKEK